ncbi:hypothetical protein CVT25_008675 [Psilocybe cyanescens]|uniref:Uncharacterized protein n=1 Tax=Psilocybe cyanescens TaxID=93625 RepID=A0A409XLH3_PSICY|nr:hypothetical protein CVT25_008675 [Psilocybe cyanescens]
MAPVKEEWFIVPDGVLQKETMNFSPTQAIRDAKVLETLLIQVNNAILQHNAQVQAGTKTPKVTYTPVEWDKIARCFKLAVRDGAAEYIKLHELQKDGWQYFAVVLLYTFAEMMLGDLAFRPAAEDIFFAVKIVNINANLKSITKEAHKVKTAYFRAGNQHPEPSAELLGYLQGAYADLKAVADITFKAIVDHPFDHHRVFYSKFLYNLLTTPWYNPSQWNSILGGADPFSKNLTLENYVPNAWGDDNKYYASY